MEVKAKNSSRFFLSVTCKGGMLHSNTLLSHSADGSASVLVEARLSLRSLVADRWRQNLLSRNPGKTRFLSSDRLWPPDLPVALVTCRTVESVKTANTFSAILTQNLPYYYGK